MRKFVRFWMPSMTAVAICVFLLVATQCSFLPDELEDFFALPLPAVEKGGYDINGVRVTFARTGIAHGMPIILLHGSPGSWADWKLVMTRPRLMRQFNLIAVDRPGWSEEMTPAKVYPDLGAQSNMLRKVLDLSSRQNKAILVGHSLGGPLALRMALDYPHKVAAVILLAPSLDPDLDAVLWYNRLADYKLVKFFLPKMLAQANDEIMALPDALRKLGKDMAALKIPVLLVHGQKDNLVHPDNARYARLKLVQAPYRERMLPNAGHLIPHLRPAEVIIAIEDAAKMINADDLPDRQEG